jgi:hypothetical protein
MSKNLHIYWIPIAMAHSLVDRIYSSVARIYTRFLELHISTMVLHLMLFMPAYGRQHQILVIVLIQSRVSIMVEIILVSALNGSILQVDALMVRVHRVFDSLV